MIDAMRKLEDVRRRIEPGKRTPSPDGKRTSGGLYVVPDPQERLGRGTKLLVVQGDGSAAGDTYALGAFWDERFAAALRDALEEDHVVADASIVEKLKEIERGAGAFDRDPLRHCENALKRSKVLARAALDAILGLDRDA